MIFKKSSVNHSYITSEEFAQLSWMCNMGGTILDQFGHCLIDFGHRYYGHPY